MARRDYPDEAAASAGARLDVPATSLPVNLIYLVCAACGRRWSLDSRRTRLRGSADWGGSLLARFETSEFARQLGVSRRVLVTVLHNCGMVVTGAQICILYATAGLYKVQGGD